MRPKSLVEWLKEKGIEVEKEAEKEIREHMPVISKVSPESISELVKFFPFQSKEDNIEPTKSLGLHLEPKGETFSLKAHYYIGYWWISKEENIYIRIAPKVRKGKRLDFVSVLKEILSDDFTLKEALKYMDEKNPSRRLFGFELESPPIPVSEKTEELTLFAILHFIYLVEKIVKKGLKKDYLRRNAELNSRIKGKLLVGQTIRNFTKGNLTKPICSFIEYGENNVANIILKATLLQIKRYLASQKGELFRRVEGFERKLSYLLCFFENVSSKTVTENDFKKVKLSPFYPEYRKALLLARLILRNLGFNPFSPTDEISVYHVVPYFINMPMLFELYALKHMRKEYKEWQLSYQPVISCQGMGKLIPDFIIKSENNITIADAKYKEKPLKEDFQQLCLYGRIKNISQDKKIELKLILPSFIGEKKRETNCLYRTKVEFLKLPLM